MFNLANFRFYCFLNRRIESLTLMYGRSFILTAFKIRIRRFITPHEAIIKKVSNKKIRVPIAGTMTVNTMDYLGYTLYSEGIYEPQTINFFRNNLCDRDNVLDIGANIGYHSLILSTLIGSGHVFAFEPNPQILPTLYNNIKSSGRKNIHVYEVGVGNRNLEQDFYVPDGEKASSGQASLRVLNGKSITKKIKLVTLDSNLGWIPPIRLVKMDIEGAEGLALEGMNEFLNRDKPLLVFEFSPDFLILLGTDPASLIDNLEKTGYQLYVLGESISPLLSVPKTQINILGIHHADHLADNFKKEDFSFNY